jgi:hypothetical protein
MFLGSKPPFDEPSIFSDTDDDFNAASIILHAKKRRAVEVSQGFNILRPFKLYKHACRWA